MELLRTKLLFTVVYPPKLNRKTYKVNFVAMDRFCLAQGLSVTDVLEEIGGGLNLTRKKFLQIIHWVIQGEVKLLCIAHKDRLCRFGVDLIEQIIIWGGGELIVANSESLSPHEELMQDLLSIIHCFSRRLYGLRKYKKKD